MAEYTIEFENAKTTTGATLYEAMYDPCDTIFDDDEKTNKFREYFKNRWAIYEIYTTDVEDWVKRFENYLTTLAPKYLEKIKAYETKIGVLDGIVIKRATDNYDLPVKGTETIQPRVNPVSGYPTKSYDATVSGGQNTADIRNNYINKVRDLWLEFVEEFASLFYQIY